MTTLLLLALLAAAEAPPADATRSAPDLEIVALQTTGPGRIGDCNAVVARLHNAGTVATAQPPAVRLELSGATVWSRTAQASAALEAGATVEIWFEQVPLAAGLSRLEATSDPDQRVAESDESNNGRQVPRDPQLACGAPDPPPRPALELRVLVTARDAAALVSSPARPIAGAAVEVTTSLRAGIVLAAGKTAADGRATLSVPSDPRSPVLRVAASAPGCATEMRVAMPASPAAALELSFDLACSSTDGGAAAPSAASAMPPGALEIETALPGRVQVDDEPAVEVTFGSRLTVERPGARVRLRATSLLQTPFYDRTLEVPRDGRRELVIDAPALRASAGDPEVVEDLRSGLQWTVGAASTGGYDAAAALCEQLERAGVSDWRLPDIDELAFVLEERARVAAAPAATGASSEGGVPLRGLSDCCVWSSTPHAGGRLTFYLDGGHIYGRHGDESGVGALCARGAAYEADPLRVPGRYHDRLPGPRRFRPHD